MDPGSTLDKIKKNKDKEIWDYQGRDYEDYDLLEYDTVYLLVHRW